MKRVSILVVMSFIFCLFVAAHSMAAATGGQTGQTQQQPGAQMQQPGMQQQAQMQEPLKAEDLEGKTVKDQQGEDLGKIDSVMMDPQSGRSYAVLEGEEDRMHPIPMNAIQRGQEKDEFRVNISKDQLANAPHFQKDSPPNLSDPQWQQTVHGYYGVQPGQQQQQQQQPGMQQQPQQGTQTQQPGQ